MKITAWDGTQLCAKDRDEAVKKVKGVLKQWMEKTDRIVWEYTHEEMQERGEKPNIATVVTEHGEHTDAYAVIFADE